MEKYNLAVLNALEICSGTFTWVKNKIPVEKSVLDYVITSQDLVSSVNSLKIYEAKEFTPWRSVKCGKRYSDHDAIIVYMSVNKHSKKDRGKSKLVWNFNDPSGWEKCHKIIISDRSLLQCWQNNNDPEMNYGIWSKKVNVILRECFKKRCIRNDKLLYTKEIRSLIKKRKAVKKHIKICIRPLCKGRHKFKKLDSLINRKIAHFNDDIIRQKVGSDGSISKQDFWKIKGC